MRTTGTSGSCLDATLLTGKVADAAASGQLDGACGCYMLSLLCRGILEGQVHLCVVLATAHRGSACHSVMLIHRSYRPVDHTEVAVFSCC